jgi:hypothetical protein
VHRAVLSAGLVVVAMLAAGCASGRGPEPRLPAAPPGPEGASSQGPETPPAPPSAPTEATAAVPPGGAESAGKQESEKTGGPSPCALEREGDDVMVDDARRKLFETLCGASLWFDGLFGEGRDVAAARSVYGRAELSFVHSEVEGFKVRGRLRVRVKLPNLENRVEAFLGREDEEDEVIRGREEGFALRSQFLGVESSERWLGGLGYSVPGNFRVKRDFRVGIKGGSEPEIFAQGRLRRNFLIGQSTAIRLRETVFWTNRDGFGSTSSFDFDHLLSRVLLFRWGSVGTVSEETEGLDWRSALVLYHNLRGHRAIAYETFVRGETEWVDLKEYGARAIYRQSLLGRPWLYGEGIVGYSWPRLDPEDERQGSFSIGIGLELHFGRDLR